MGLEDMVTSVTGADTIIILRVMVVLCGVILFSASVPFSEAKHWKFIKKNPDILDDNLMNILFYEKGFLDKKIKTEILRGIVLVSSSLIGILFTIFEVNQIMDAGRMFYILSSYLVIAYTIRCIVDSLGWIFSIKDIKQRYASNSDGMKKLQGFMKRNSVREGANKQVISSQADSLIKISRIWADFFPANNRISLFRLFFPPFLALFPVFTEISPTDVSFGPPETGWPG